MLEPDIAARFGASVRHFRRRLGISQEGLAEHANLHRTYIAGIEGGSRNVTLRSLDKLARALQVSTATLLTADPATFETDSSPAGRDLVDILLVEDNPYDVELTLEAFKRSRFMNPTHIVRDGEEALDFLFCRGQYAHRDHSNVPKVVLLDLGLPKLSGLEVLRSIKQNRRTQNIPVVILTVSQRDKDIAECRRLGAESYIMKPVDFPALSSITPELKLNWGLFKSPASLEAGL